MIRTRFVSIVCALAPLAALAAFALPGGAARNRPVDHAPFSAAREAPAPALRVLPPVLELGPRAPGSVTRTSVWLVNAGDAPAPLARAKTGCGCVALAGELPAEVPARGALEVALDVRAPDAAGAAKSVALHFLAPDGADAAASIALATAEGAADAAEPAPHPLLAAAPARLALGRLAPGEERAGSLWLVNPGDRPLALSAVETGCGCTKVDFEPARLAPGAALELPFRVVAPEQTGARARVLTVLVDGADPLRVPVAYEVAR